MPNAHRPSSPVPSLRQVVPALVGVLGALLAALVATAGSPAHAQGGSGSISGRVTDLEGAPLDGICVSSVRVGATDVHRAQTVTQQGAYLLDELEDGYYELLFLDCTDQPRYQSTGLLHPGGETLLVEVLDGAAVTGIDRPLGLREDPQAGTITGTVTLPDDIQVGTVCIGTAIVSDGFTSLDVTQTARDPDQRQIDYELAISVRFGEVDGVYVTAYACDSGAAMAIYDGATGTLNPSAAVAVELGTDNVDLTLQPAPRFTTRVQEPDGTAADACWDLIAPTPDESAELRLGGVSDAGEISAFGFAGEQQLRLTHCPRDGSPRRLLPLEQPLSLPGNDLPDVLVLTPGGRIEGRVSGPDGAPLERTTAVLQDRDGGIVGFGREQSNGGFVTDPQAPGSYQLVVRAPDQRFELLTEVARQVTIPTGTDVVEVHLTLERAAGLRVPLHTDGTCAGLVSPVIGPLGPPYFLDLLQSGEALLTGLRPGTYDVAVGCERPRIYRDVTVAAGEVLDLGAREPDPPEGGEEDPVAEEPDTEEPAEDPAAEDPEDGSGDGDPPSTERFVDVPRDATHAQSILRLVEAGITEGCGPDVFCPRDPVTREQMATFLVRALDLPAPDDPTTFTDVDDDNVHADSIQALAADGITRGCADDAFCPRDPVTREQMATFLVRALGL